MRRMRATGALTTVLLLMLAASVALAAHHEGEGEGGGDRKAWDQARMTDLSGKLSTATSELRRAFRALLALFPVDPLAHSYSASRDRRPP